MSDPKKPGASPVQDLAGDLVVSASGRAPEMLKRPSRLGASGEGRLDDRPFDAPLEAPIPEVDAAEPVPVRLPASVLVVDAERRRGSQTAARLMEHGYTCRVVTPSDLDGAVRGEGFDAALVELGIDPAGGGALVEAVAGAVRGGVVVSSPRALDLPGASVLLLKPWLTHQAVLAVEEARARFFEVSGVDGGASSALDAATLRVTTRDASPADPAAGAPRSRGVSAAPSLVAPGIQALPKAPASAWESFDERVVRARLMDTGGAGFTPARVRRATLDGVLEIEARRSLPGGSRLRAELFLSDGRRADFDGRVGSSGPPMRVVLEIDAADVPFFHAWVNECLDPSLPRADPVRLVPEVGLEPADRLAASDDIDELWAAAAADLDDDARQQRFIQACLKTSQLDLAVRRYRSLKETMPGDPRPPRYLQQVGTILGFYMLKQNAPAVEEGISLRLKLTLGAFVLGAAVLFALSRLLS